MEHSLWPATSRTKLKHCDHPYHDVVYPKILRVDTNKGKERERKEMDIQNITFLAQGAISLSEV